MSTIKEYLFSPFFQSETKEILVNIATKNLSPPLGLYLSQRPSASVAVAVAQMAAISMSTIASPLQSTVSLRGPKQDQRKQLMGKGHRGQDHVGQARERRKRRHESSNKPSLATVLSYHNWSNLKRNWLNWILALGLSLVCQLTFRKQSEPWNMESVMTFLFLSRLTYADFQKSLSYF